MICSFFHLKRSARKRSSALSYAPCAKRDPKLFGKSLLNRGLIRGSVLSATGERRSASDHLSLIALSVSTRPAANCQTFPVAPANPRSEADAAPLLGRSGLFAGVLKTPP